jgi:hypothetical protein
MKASSHIRLLVFCLASAPLGALELYVAPLAVQADAGDGSGVPGKPEKELMERLSRSELGTALQVRSAEQTGGEPLGSFLDAARLCEREGYPYLLYGYVKKTEYSLYAELKLLERDKKEVAAVFFAGDDASHYSRMMDDLALKISKYFGKDVGLLPPEKKPEPKRNLLYLTSSLGYWTPLGGEWGRVLSGLGAIQVGLRFIPRKPLMTAMSKEWYMALGLDVEYGLGMNTPSYESFIEHSFKFRLPLEMVMEIGVGQELGVGIAGLVQIDTMAQDRRYTSTFVSTTAVGGASLFLLYRYSVSPGLALGLETLFDVAGYSDPLLTVSPRVFLDWKLGDWE